ncbi:O-antigen ligase family protein [Alcaligenes nematophilus]|uniref:O-antigen ligase family protein n=1 Tax=Alcaligenes nematophilus TaxID=2994643 RepID=UPI0035B51751
MLTSSLFSSKGHRVTSVLLFLFLVSLLSTKSGYSYALGLLVAYSLWHAIQLPSVSMQKSEAWILVWLLLFAILGMLAAVIHGAPLNAYEVPIKFALAVVLVVCCLSLPPKPAFVWMGLALGTCSGLAVAYWKMLNSTEFKAYGYTGAIQFGNLSLTMGVILLIGLSWSLYNKCERRRGWTALLALGSVCGLLGSYFSGTRGGWIAIPMFILLFFVAYLRRSNLLTCTIVLVAIVGSGLVFSAYSPLVQERIHAAAQDMVEYKTHGFESAGSIGSRLAIWETSLDMLKDKPVWGWGETQFRTELKRREQAGMLGLAPATLANTHNTFIEVWMMYGGLTLLALLGLLISLAWHFLRYIRHSDSILRSYSLAGLCLVMGYVVYGQTQIMLIRNNTLVFFLLMIAVLLGLLRQRRLELQK